MVRVRVMIRVRVRVRARVIGSGLAPLLKSCALTA